MSTTNSPKKYKLKKFGPITERRVYSKVKAELKVCNLLDVQKQSFEWFLDKGLEESIEFVFPIKSTNEKISIEYIKGSIRVEKPEDEYEQIKKAKQKSSPFNVKVFATLRKSDLETGVVDDPQEVLVSEIPLMTKGGNFVINGSTKVIVSQLIRSPGAYYELLSRKGSDKDLFNKMEIIPKMGMWLGLFHKATKLKTDVKISIDKTNISLSTFLRSLYMGKDTIISLFGDSDLLQETIKRDKKESEKEALDTIHGLLRPGDRITDESRKNLFANYLFNRRRYDLSKTGRYLINKKFGVAERLNGLVLAEDLKMGGVDGKVLYKKGTLIDEALSLEIQKQYKDKVLPLIPIPDIDPEYLYGRQVELFPGLKKRNKIILIKVFKSLQDQDEGKVTNIIGNDPSSNETHLLISDIVAAIGYYFNFIVGIGSEDDSDSLVNKRIVTIGEQLQNQFQVALTKMERACKERMSANDPETITAKRIINNKIFFNQFKQFFNSSQLSQFMDQVNPLSEIGNKRRVTSLGPGGLNRETAIVEVRDVHSTHFGRLCPIESPEGPNIGLILNFALYARVNSYGFIETPYFKVEKGIVNFKKIEYLQASDEISKTFVQATLLVDDSNKIVDKNIIARKDGDYITVAPTEIDYMSVSSKQMTSISSACIPFLENDDANRALMGANMQRQAVPSIYAEAPFVATGSEADVAASSSSNVFCEEKGVVDYVDSNVVVVKTSEGKQKRYSLRNFERTNQGTVITQKPIVNIGDTVKPGTILCDGSSFDNAELAIGKNVVVGFSTWNGYNYEDAIIISERLFKEDVYTSIHIEEQTIKFRKAKSGDDILVSEVPNVSNFSKRNLDESGIVMVGSEVQAGDILVGRVSPKENDNPEAAEKLLATIFGQKTRKNKDTSLKVKHGHGGTVIDVQVLSREHGDKLQDEISMIVKVLIAQKRKIKVGDKMSGRHGNKGVISIVLPIEDMPHLEDGTPVDVLLNPQGVPSRMNIGQVLEAHLGMAAKVLGVKFVTPPFDGIKHEEIDQALKEAKLPEDGKFNLIDPITGTKFDNKITVGVMYMLKLNHMIDDKMHARSVGPYSLITQQPLGGKSQNGGQRFGEMEAWSIESYGATNVLQELLTYKSDNIEGRNKLYNAISNGMRLPKPGTPESFSVLAYELRGLCMKLGVEVEERGDDNE